MKLRLNKMSATHRVNASALISYTVIIAILLFAYVLELVKGSRTLTYTLIFAALDLIPWALCVMIFLKDRRSKVMKYVFSLGFSFLYAYVLLTAAVPTTFVYIFLIMFLITPYGDMKLCVITGALAIVSNVIAVAFGFTSGSLTTDDLAIVEIQLISVLLASVFSWFATRVIGQVNAQRIEELNGEKEKSEELLSTTLELSRGISGDIDEVSIRMEQLNKSVNATKDSMSDVSMGANETAEAMQVQLLQTEEIVEHVNKVKQVSKIIAEDVRQTEETITIGKDNINNLLNYVNKSEEASSTVASKMTELTENTEKMNSIVDMINSVTRQTSMLSLNASIEAARAGEAGKGFAVVASEISSLAKQTSDATISITELIEEITLSIDEVFKAINLMMESNKEQNKSAETMAANFENIEMSARNIYDLSDDLENVIRNLAKSNESIVESINNVSAITEEVSARANETLTDSEKDAQIVDEMASVFVELNEKAKRLNR